MKHCSTLDSTYYTKYRTKNASAATQMTKAAIKKLPVIRGPFQLFGSVGEGVADAARLVLVIVPVVGVGGGEAERSNKAEGNIFV